MNFYRAPAFQYSILKARLGESGIVLQDEVTRTEPLQGEWTEPVLRPYQEAALACWKVSGRRGIVVLPTGSGKTVLAIAAIASTAKSTLILVPTRVLMEQWQQKISEFFKLPIGQYGDGDHELAPITVCTFESAYRYMDRLGNQFELLIVDEVHHFGHGTRDEALEMSVAPFRLGLTATPPTGNQSPSRITELVGPMIYELSIAELRGNYLAAFELLSIQLDLNPEERLAYEVEIDTFRKFHSSFRKIHGNVNWKTFINLASRSPEGWTAIGAWHRARRITHFTQSKREALVSLLNQHSSRKKLIFTADNETAYSIARQFLVMPITSDIKRKEREEALDQFRGDTLKTLVSCRVLNEGLDVPDAEIAIIVGGTLGEREHVQRIGRCLRPAPGKKALVYELISRNTIEMGHSQRRAKSLGPKVAASL